MICNKCNQDKNEDEFAFKSKPKGLRQKTCRICLKEYRKEYYFLNKDYAVEYAKASSKKIRERNQQYIWDFLLENPCIDCGESNPIVLDFDHKDDCSKIKDISTAISHGWSIEKIENEIKKCDIRCANCHRKRTAQQFGWYKNILKKGSEGVPKTDK